MSRAEDAFSQCTGAEIRRMTQCIQEFAAIFEEEGREFKKAHRRSMTDKKGTKSND